MTDILAKVSAATTLAKNLLTLPAIVASAEAKLAIADLQIELAEMRTQLSLLISENHSLKESLNARIRTDLQHRNGKYFKPDGDGPYCTCCFDSGGELIRLIELEVAFRDIGRWHCPKCDNVAPE